jgi:hypothetical protein
MSSQVTTPQTSISAIATSAVSVASTKLPPITQSTMAPVTNTARMSSRRVIVPIERSSLPAQAVTSALRLTWGGYST